MLPLLVQMLEEARVSAQQPQRSPGGPVTGPHMLNFMERAAMYSRVANSRPAGPEAQSGQPEALLPLQVSRQPLVGLG